MNYSIHMYSGIKCYVDQLLNPFRKQRILNVFFLIVDGPSNQGTIQFSKYLSYAPYEPGTGLVIKQPVLKQNELFFSYKNTHGASLEN